MTLSFYFRSATNFKSQKRTVKSRSTTQNLQLHQNILRGRFAGLACLLKQSYINFALRLHGKRASSLWRDLACYKRASRLCRDEISHVIVFHPVWSRAENINACVLPRYMWSCELSFAPTLNAFFASFFIQVSKNFPGKQTPYPFRKLMPS